MAIYAPYALKLHTDEQGSAVLLGGITQQQLQMNYETARQTTAGSLDPYFHEIIGVKPMATFTTLAIKKALDELGTRGLKITSSTNPGVVQYLAQIDPETGQPLSGGNHISRTYKAGLIYPQRVTCAQAGSALLTIALAGRHDGTNDTVVVAESVTLPTGLVDNERFGLGVATVESVSITRKTNFDLDFGLTVQQIAADGDTQPQFVHLEQGQARITIQGLNPDDLKSAGVPFAGLAATHANTAIQLRKRANGTMAYASGSVNITFSAAGGAVWDNAIDASGNTRAGATLAIEPYHDGTNLPVTVDTAAAAL